VGGAFGRRDREEKEEGNLRRPANWRKKEEKKEKENRFTHSAIFVREGDRSGKRCRIGKEKRGRFSSFPSLEKGGGEGGGGTVILEKKTTLRGGKEKKKKKKKREHPVVSVYFLKPEKKKGKKGRENCFPQ